MMLLISYALVNDVLPLPPLKSKRVILKVNTHVLVCVPHKIRLINL